MTRKDEIKKIWKECFRDPDDWIEMYFSRVYNDRDALTLEKGDKTVSSLLLQPYSMKFQNTEVTVGYIAGAATRRNARGNGYMSELMVNALNSALERGFMACALIPPNSRLYSFYGNFDFSTVFYTDPQRFTSLHRFKESNHYTPVNDPYAPGVYSAFHAFELERKCGILHSQRDFLNILDDIAHDSGCFAAVEDSNGAVAAMGWGAMQDDRLTVKELLGTDEAARETVLAHIQRHFPDTPVTVLAPAENNGRRLFAKGMIRIVNAPLCLGIIAAANLHLSLIIRLSDNLMPTNSHTYIIKEGVCTIDDTRTASLDFDLDADTFNRIVFSSSETGSILNFPSERPHMSLMLD